MIVANTSTEGSQVVHIDAFILEFEALPSLPLEQVVLIETVVLEFDILVSSPVFRFRSPVCWCLRFLSRMRSS